MRFSHRWMLTFVGLCVGLGVTAAMLGLSAAGSAVAAQPGKGDANAPSPLTVGGASRLPNIAERMSALDPGNPGGYLLLADEVAAESEGRTDRDLARQLYTLALSTDLARPAGGAGRGLVAQSACYGLAGLTRRAAERRWLLSIVEIIDTDPLSLRRKLPRALGSLPELTESVAFDVATLMALTRAAEGRRAEAILKRPGVSDALEEFSGLLEEFGQPGGTDRIKRDMVQWPSCSECSNRRFVTRSERDANGKTQVRPRLCPKCFGSPGPALSDGELLGQYKMESALLRGIHRLWSAQALVDSGEPLRDPDPAEIARQYGVDTTKTVYRAGGWVAP